MIRKIGKIFKDRNFNSKDYWETRYKTGQTSGSGSYNYLADFKAKILNEFVAENNIKSVIEFGCGDGNQLKLAKYPRYIGLDVSPTVIQICKEIFSDDSTKSFFLYDYRCFQDNHNIFLSELSLSLDVLYHLTEQKVYDSYLIHLFSSASRYVIIYSSNDTFSSSKQPPHERRRKFTEDVTRLIKGWELQNVIKNEFPSKYYGDQEGSLSDFYIYSKIAE